MGTLLERPLIKMDFDQKYPILVDMMNGLFDEAKTIYDDQMAVKKKTNKFPIHKNMPRMTGGLRWAKELRDRITNPMWSFKQIEHP